MSLATFYLNRVVAVLPATYMSFYKLATGHKIPKNTVAILVLSKSSGYIGADEKMVSRFISSELALIE